jgi:hypothetical protein
MDRPGKVSQPNIKAVSGRASWDRLFSAATTFYSGSRFKLGRVSKGRQMRLLLCAALLLMAAMTVVSAVRPPVEVSSSDPSKQSNFSSQAKTSAHFAPLREFDIPVMSIETLDMGSAWDDEASAYDLTRTAQQAIVSAGAQFDARVKAPALRPGR